MAPVTLACSIATGSKKSKSFRSVATKMDLLPGLIEDRGNEFMVGLRSSKGVRRH